MKITSRYLFLLIMLSSLAIAEESKKLYKWVDKNGKVHYSDQPRKGAEEIQVRQLPAVKMKLPQIPLQSRKSADTEKQAQSNQYDSVKISYPENDSVVRNNAGIVTLSAAIQPALAKGHTISYFIDGKQVAANSRSITQQVKELTHGSHTASFKIIDDQGKTLQASDTVSFTLLHRINRNKR